MEKLCTTLGSARTGTDPVSECYASFFPQKEHAASCGRRSGWKHKGRKPWRRGEEYSFERAVEKPQRRESVCLLSCTQQQEREERHMVL